MHCVVEDVVPSFFFSTLLISSKDVALGAQSPGRYCPELDKAHALHPKVCTYVSFF